MTYHMNQTETLYRNPGWRLLVAGSLAFGLAACGESPSDNGANDASSDATSGESVADSSAPAPTASAYGPIDYSAAYVVDGVAFGELSMGNPDAPVTMIEYASLTCSHCAYFHNNVLPELKTRYIETGQVRLVFRNYILNQFDLYASMISRCAGPERAFGMMTLFYNRQAQWMNDDIVANLAALARRAGLNRAAFDMCLQNAPLQANILEMQEMGSNQDNVTGTPTFFINGERIDGAVPIEEFIEVIEDEL
jgi:protein-disulfide isomerase